MNSTKESSHTLPGQTCCRFHERIQPVHRLYSTGFMQAAVASKLAKKKVYLYAKFVPMGSRQGSKTGLYTQLLPLQSVLGRVGVNV